MTSLCGHGRKDNPRLVESQLCNNKKICNNKVVEDGRESIGNGLDFMLIFVPRKLFNREVFCYGEEGPVVHLRRFYCCLIS